MGDKAHARTGAAGGAPAAGHHPGALRNVALVGHRQGRSVQLSLIPVDWDGHRINLLDTPGYADFVGEVRAGLRAADAPSSAPTCPNRRSTGTRWTCAP